MLCPGEEGRCEDRGAEGRTLFYDHLGLEQLQETYIPSASLETQLSGPAPTSNDLCWYKSAPTAQMTAWVFFFFFFDPLVFQFAMHKKMNKLFFIARGQAFSTMR